MKKRVCAMAAVFMLMLSMTIQAAEPRAVRPSASLLISGTTASCTATVRSGDSKDFISVSMELWKGSTRVASWTGSGTGSVSMSKTYTVVKGGSYELTVNATVAGTALSEVSTSGTC